MPMILSFLMLTTWVQAQAWKDWQIQVGCAVYDMKGTFVRHFPGAICDFHPDGTLISSTDSVIRRVTKDSDVLWEHKENIHHQMKLSSDQKRILTLGSHVTTEPKGTNRDDKILILGLDGKILHQRLFSHVLRQVRMPTNYWPLNQVIFGEKVQWETSHLNSIYEIPPLANGKHPAWMRPGNIVVSGLHHGVFVLSPDLQTILHHQRLPYSVNHWTHDVQVTGRGTWLYFNNMVDETNRRALSVENFSKMLFGGADYSMHSGIYEVDASGKIVGKFTAAPKEFFYSWRCGGIQEVDQDTWLFNHAVHGLYLYSRKQNKVLMYTLQAHGNLATSRLIQEAKARDLNEFLRLWK